MGGGANDLCIRPDGSVDVAPGTLRGRLALRAGRYRLRDGDPRLLILERADADTADRVRVLMSGEIIDRHTVLEIVNLIAHGNWSGELRVLGEATRGLVIDRGALRGATTNVLAERLGEVMVAAGVIERSQLAECLREQLSPQRLGETAIERGLLAQDTLFRTLTSQAERIFQNALGVAEGHYVFSLIGEADAPAMTVHLPIQQLLMESVQRIDEMSALRERIPSGDLCPQSLPAAARMSMRRSLIPIALRADGTRSIHEIARDLHLDEFEATRRVLQLLQIGAVELTERRELSVDAVAPLVRQVNEILREIRDTVTRHRGEAQMRSTFQSWVRDTPLDQVFGEALHATGEVSADELVKRLRATSGERTLDALVQAAHELIAFAMFSASPTLPRDAERALSKWVNQRMGRIAA
jgi:hypothetical protein